jgi:hypothetical protein
MLVYYANCISDRVQFSLIKISGKWSKIYQFERILFIFNQGSQWNVSWFCHFSKYHANCLSHLYHMLYLY